MENEHQDELRRLVDWAEQARSALEKKTSDLEIDAEYAARQRTLYDMKFLPTQAAYLDAVSSGKFHVVLLTAGNKLGKTWVLAYDLISESLGYQPHDGRRRQRSGYDIALLLRDYDSHAAKLYREGFLQMLPQEYCNVVSRTQSGVPRIIQPIDPLTGVHGKHIHIFTHDQDASRVESGSWQRIGIDEPCPRRHWEGLLRGLQTTGGMCTMTMTLLEGSAWIWEDIHCMAENQGGPNKRFFALTADPEENRVSRGGFIPDQAVDDYRAIIPPELWDARVLGKALHLSGRVYKEFDSNVHVLDKPLHTPEEIKGFPKALVIDPHPRLPFFMLWAYIAPGDVIIVYDEWPSEDLEKLHYNNFNLDDYANIVNAKDLPSWGLMDPNYGRTKSLTTGLTIAEEMTVRTGIGFQTEIDDSLATGHLAVSERLRFDRRKPIDIMNQPRLLISPNCVNVRRSFNNYIWQEWKGKTAEGRGPNPKPQERYKHAMDTIRYLCVYSGVRFSHLRTERKHVLRKGGKEIYTSFRSRLQENMERRRQWR